MGFIRDLFNDNNTINEKSVIGFISFTFMIITLILDLCTGYMGKELVIHEYIFDGFLITTLGSLGIASIDKWIVNNKKTTEEG